LPSGGFDHWKFAIECDKNSDLHQSKIELTKAAKAFFEEGSGNRAGVSRALFEYSTLMDAFALVQEGRILRNELRFEDSLNEFVTASEILRATIHFAYLASYVSGCATLETALEMESNDEKFQGLKNSIALFEQSKIALSFRDERHPSLRSIDALVKFAISRALLVESQTLSEKGSLDESRMKIKQAENVENDLVKLEGRGKIEPSRYKIEYLSKYDCERALDGAMLATFPEARSLWIGNVGNNPAYVEGLGEKKVERTVDVSESSVCPLESSFHGKLRISYMDETTGNRFDEGCLTVI